MIFFLKLPSLSLVALAIPLSPTIEIKTRNMMEPMRPVFSMLFIIEWVNCFEFIGLLVYEFIKFTEFTRFIKLNCLVVTN